MRRYIDTAHFHAALKPYAFQGTEWPEARAYFDTSQVRAPYKRGFYQDNSLQGLGVIQYPLTAPAIPTWALLLGSFVGGILLAKAVVK